MIFGYEEAEGYAKFFFKSHEILFSVQMKTSPRFPKIYMIFGYEEAVGYAEIFKIT